VCALEAAAEAPTQLENATTASTHLASPSSCCVMATYSPAWASQAGELASGEPCIFQVIS
jgi:hypothetical protein